jgi:hypothetical protein
MGSDDPHPLRQETAGQQFLYSNSATTPAQRVRSIGTSSVARIFLTDIDPQAWLADVLARINEHAIHRLDQLLPWNWKLANEPRKLAAWPILFRHGWAF